MSSGMSADELEFVRAIENYKKTHSKTFLSWSEVLTVIRELGYRRSEQQRRRRVSAREGEGQGS